MNSVEDLDVFKLAHQLALKTYAATKTFPKEELFSLGDQTRRAAGSVRHEPYGRLQRWKAAGRRIEIVYLRISSPQLGLRRIAARVKKGGHNVPRRDVIRRFTRSWNNFRQRYRLLADAWSVYDNSGRTPKLMERSL